MDDFEAFKKELESQPSQAFGEVFVFVDECHSTQSGKLHRFMKAMLPNAVFIGFTGTPLLKQDRQTTLEVFGSYIHTYKLSEGVEDRVVLDLVYEARDIDQKLGLKDRIDAWFDAKTRGLNDWQKDELKKQWGTLQNVLSSRSRMERVVSDIIFDFSVKLRLSNDRGNATLVVSSIYEACKYFTLFQKTQFKGKCAVVTSYNPQTRDITLEETGANTETDKQFIYNTYNELLKDVVAKPNISRTETYEEDLQPMSELTKNVTKGHSDETPLQLNTPGKRAVYNNLMKPLQDNVAVAENAGVYAVDSATALKRALEIDAAVKQARPDDWRGVQAREQVVKAALYSVLKDQNEVERIFKIIFQQQEY